MAKDGGPAFPQTPKVLGADLGVSHAKNWATGKTAAQERGAIVSHSGMSRRDYFAGQAMQGLLIDSPMRWDGKELAKIAVEYADALLEELK